MYFKKYFSLLDRHFINVDNLSWGSGDLYSIPHWIIKLLTLEKSLPLSGPESPPCTVKEWLGHIPYTLLSSAPLETQAFMECPFSSGKVGVPGSLSRLSI